MRSTLTGRTRRYLSDAAGAFERAPVEVAVAVALAAAFSWAIEQRDDAMRTWLELALGSVLLLAAAWSGTLLHALGSITARARWVITGIGAVVAALYVAFVAQFELAAEVWRAAMLASAAALWAVAAPAVATDWAHGTGLTATDRMRIVSGRVLLRAIGALLYCGALYIGLALALGSVNTLFELNLDGSIYVHVFGWIFMVLAPWIVAGGLATYVEQPAPRTAVAGVVNRMAAFLVPPLLALYYVILYAYTIRIAVTGEVPKNLVSPLVFAAGVLAALGLVLFDPRSREATAFRTLRAAPPLFLPLAALGAWTIMLRVAQYGWTEFRLLRLLLLCGMALLAAAATVQLLRRQRLLLHLIPLGLALLLAFGAVGPWSVLAVSRRDQQARLDRALATLPEPTADRARADTVPRIRVPGEVHRDIAGATRYLAVHFGIDALPPRLGGVVTSRDEAYDVTRRLGLDPIDTVPPDAPRMVHAALQPGVVLPLEGGSIRRVRGFSAERRGPAEHDVVVQDSARLVIRAAGEELTADLAELAGALAASYEPDPRRQPLGTLQGQSASLDVRDAAGRRRGTLVVLDVMLSFEERRYRLVSLDGLLVLGQEDAPR